MRWRAPGWGAPASSPPGGITTSRDTGKPWDVLLPEHDVAVALRRVARVLEEHGLIEEAVLTLAAPGE
jgi:hypothetical protein